VVKSKREAKATNECFDFLFGLTVDHFKNWKKEPFLEKSGLFLFALSWPFFDINILFLRFLFVPIELCFIFAQLFKNEAFKLRDNG
jgi:hypothetical protein